MTLKAQIEIDVSSECGLVLQQAGRSAVLALRIQNNGEKALSGLRLRIESDVGLFRRSEIAVDSVQSGETVSVQIPNGELCLDYGFLSRLTDALEAEARVVLIDSAGAELAHAAARQTVYPPDRTLGCARPVYYASFVIPGCDAVSRLQSAVARELEKATGSSSITGYLKEKSGVYALCKAVYMAIHGLGLTYAVSPASFGLPGQKVRLPDEILMYKTGCCLDTTLLFAALFEKCGLRPVVILQKTHAFVGCHLVDRSFRHPVVTDAEVLRKAIQEDTFVAIETTLVCGDGSFSDAEKSAKDALSDDSVFECAVDVALARGMGIRPLPVVSGGGFGEVDGRSVDVEAGSLRSLTDDVDLAEVASSIEKPREASRVDGWAQRLLDLSKGNKLLNIRENARILPILCPSPAALEDAIAADKSFRVKSYENFLDPEASAEFRNLEASSAVERYGDAMKTSLSQSELWCALPGRDTDKRLKEIYRAARVDLEESGVNTLFLSLGVLEWHEAGNTSQRYRAPILLLPVRLERHSVSHGYTVRRIDEDAVVNTTLLELLKREHGLSVPGLDPLPVDESGCAVDRIFGIFRAAVRDVAGLNVREECILGQFSFGKFVMWKDLTSRIEAVGANPIVSHLMSRGGSFDDGVEIFRSDEVGLNIDYGRMCCPLSADSSQLAAVLYSALGKSFVLHGPPGTGKSQTITNIIAHNLSFGKRVLFVSEKKAALDVVYGRLSKLGLAPFCLQLHSNKAGKADVYAQFREVLEIGSRTPAVRWDETVRETEAERAALDKYVAALHRQTVSGFTPYDLFTRQVCGGIGGDATLLSGSAREVTRERYDAALRAVSSAAQSRRGIPTDAVRSLACVRPFAWSPNAESRLAAEAEFVAVEIAEAAKGLEAFGDAYEADARIVERYFEVTREIKSLEGGISSVYDTGVLRALSVRDLRNRMKAAEQAFLPIRIFKIRSMLKEYASLLKSGRLDRLGLREAVKLATRLQDLDAAAKSVEAKARGILDGGFDPRMADRVIRMEARAKAENRLLEAFSRLSAMADVDGSEVGAERAAEAARAIAGSVAGNLRRTFMYFEARKEIPGFAAGIAEALDADESPDAGEWTDRFERAFQERLFNEVLESEPVFGSFSAASREEHIARFRELDAKCAALSLQNLIAKLSAKVPRHDGRVRRGDTSELGLLMHECGKKIRQKPIRQMLAEAPELVPEIKPCFLMSPLSVAQYLPVDAGFDLVVFDEASQIPVWDAIGVIARGRQLVVVGDPKQLPPTNFFQKGLDEEAVDEDLESILDECLHAGIMSCHLGWHYRSRHESLIAFSNSRYYGNRLHVFPAAELSDRLGVSFVHVPDGVYDARESRTNRREAETVADLVVARMSDPALARKSIGVVTFSEAQRALVEDVVDERRALHPELEAMFSPDLDEPFFVKNLENVQGDERDAIFFSVGYAPDEGGKFNMVFGPLSIQGGERRLNVAITRAREKIVVVSSIHAGQIDTGRTTTQGPSDLKAFLDYAERGYRIAIPSGDSETDGFASEIAAVLERAGAKVDRNVGCGGARIDVAVRDPEDGSRYVLGVVCDGRGYAGESTTRDRDCLRDEVFASLGWNLHHVWIADWALDRARAEERLLGRYKQSTEKGKEEKT